MRGKFAILGAGAILLSATACDVNYDRQSRLDSPSGPALVANVGDTVMDTRILRPPPSALGPWMTGTSETDRVLVLFTGSQRGRAVFVRHDLVQSEPEATLWAPVGVASPVSGYIAAAQPLTLTLAPGEYIPMEGRRMIVRRVERDRLEYTVE
jgi:hypothetical protein